MGNITEPQTYLGPDTLIVGGPGCAYTTIPAAIAKAVADGAAWDNIKFIQPVGGVAIDYARDFYTQQPLRFAPIPEALSAYATPAATVAAPLAITQARFRVNISIHNPTGGSLAVVAHTYTVAGTAYDGGGALSEVVTLTAQAALAGTNSAVFPSGDTVKVCTRGVFATVTSITMTGAGQTENLTQAVGIEGDIAEGVVVLDDLRHFRADSKPKTVQQLPMVGIQLADLRQKITQLATGVPLVWDNSDTNTGRTLVDATGICQNQLPADYFIISEAEKIDSLPATPSTKCLRMSATSGYTGVAWYWTLTSDLDVSDKTHLSLWIKKSAKIAKGALQLGFSTGTAFQSPVYVDVPSMGTLIDDHIVTIELTDAVRALGTAVKTVGLNVVSDLAAAYFFMYDLRVATHPFIGIAPQRYASERGIPITHACIPSVLGTTNYFTVDDVWKAVNLRGAEMAAHEQYSETATDPLDIGRALECTIGTKAAIEAIHATPGSTFFPPEVGHVCNGTIVPGNTTGPAALMQYDQMNGPVGQLVQKYFDWSMSYVYSTLRAQFGSNYFNLIPATLTAYASDDVAPTRNLVVADHGIDNEFTYAQWKTLIDRLSAWQEAGKVVCVSLSTYFGALQAAELGAPERVELAEGVVVTSDAGTLAHRPSAILSATGTIGATVTPLRVLPQGTATPASGEVAVNYDTSVLTFHDDDFADAATVTVDYLTKEHAPGNFIEGGRCDDITKFNTVTNFRNGTAANVGKFELTTKGSYGLVVSDFLDVVPTHRYAISLDANVETGDGQLKLQIYYKTVVNDGLGDGAVNAAAIWTIAQATIGTTVQRVGASFSVPWWADDVKLLFLAYPQTASDFIIDNIKIREI